MFAQICIYIQISLESLTHISVRNKLTNYSVNLYAVLFVRSLWYMIKTLFSEVTEVILFSSHTFICNSYIHLLLFVLFLCFCTSWIILITNLGGGELMWIINQHGSKSQSYTKILEVLLPSIPATCFLLHILSTPSHPSTG